MSTQKSINTALERERLDDTEDGIASINEGYPEKAEAALEAIKHIRLTYKQAEELMQIWPHKEAEIVRQAIEATAGSWSAVNAAERLISWQNEDEL
jgi:hypothetical protein